MQRYTISIEDDLAAQLDDWIRRHHYLNRSEAIRDLIRDRLARDQIESGPRSSQCVACVAYVYDPEVRLLAGRLADSQHGHHKVTVSALHVALDSNLRLEVAVLRGKSAEVLALSQSLIAERDVRHGHAHVIPIESQ
jgi:CopG family nickel-responsive transcriptional regulator